MAYYMLDAPTQANSGQRLEVSDLSVSCTLSSHSSRTAPSADEQKPDAQYAHIAVATCFCIRTRSNSPLTTYP